MSSKIDIHDKRTWPAFWRSHYEFMMSLGTIWLSLAKRFALIEPMSSYFVCKASGCFASAYETTEQVRQLARWERENDSADARRSDDGAGRDRGEHA